MTLAIIILIVSLSGVSFLLFNKIKEIDTGKSIIKINNVHDEKILIFFQKSLKSIKESPRVFLQIFILWLIKHLYNLKRKLVHKVYPKISHLVEAVKGSHVRKEGAPVSSFLEKVKEHGDNSK